MATGQISLAIACMNDMSCHLFRKGYSPNQDSTPIRLFDIGNSEGPTRLPRTNRKPTFEFGVPWSMSRQLGWRSDLMEGDSLGSEVESQKGSPILR